MTLPADAAGAPPAARPFRFACALCGLPARALDPCARRTLGELGALRRHATAEHGVAPQAIEAARRETANTSLRWVLPDGRVWAEAVPEEPAA